MNKHCRECGILLTNKNWRPSDRKNKIYKCKNCRNKYQRKYRQLYVKENTKSLGTIPVCPKCGQKGSLKIRIHTNINSGKSFSFLQVDHFKIPTSHKNGYKSSCYIGKIEK